VPGALVATWRGLRGNPFADLESGAMEGVPDLDPAAWAERARIAVADREEVLTDGEGRFRLAAAGEGRTMFLRVRARGHRVLDRSVPRPTQADADLGTLTLQRGAVVSGRVLDPAGGGIADARVLREGDGEARGWFGGELELPGGDLLGELSGQGAVTDAEGRFELAHCEPGSFALVARHAAHPQARLDGLTVGLGGTLADVQLRMDLGAAVSGRVVGVPEDAGRLRVIAAAVVQGQPPPGGQDPFAGLLGEGASEMFADFGGFGERSAEVASDGTFALAGLRSGRRYRVWAAQSGRGAFGNAACSQRLEVAAPTAGIELRYDAGVTVTCQFVDAASGAPVEQLWVRDTLRGSGGIEDIASMVPRGGGRSRAYPEGRVTLANLRPKNEQKLQLTVEAIGFRAFERKDIPLPLAGRLDLGIVRLEPAPVLRVLVRAEAGPVAGATVRVRSSEAEPQRPELGLAAWAGRWQRSSGPQSARSDEEGRCMVNLPAGGPVVVEVTSTDHAPYASEPLALAAGGEHTAELLVGGTVEIAAVDEGGRPLPDRRIEHLAEGGARDGRPTNREGLAAFEHLVPGTHRFRIARRGGMGDLARVAADLGAGAPGASKPEEGWQSVEVVDRGRATLRLVEDPSATLRGIVRQNGVPLGGARVTFLQGPGSAAEGGIEDLAGMMAEFGGGGRGRSARCGDDGSYQLRDLSVGNHRLRVTSSDRMMPALIPVTLAPGENVLDVELDVTVVRGVVRDPDGRPVPRASVVAVPVRDRQAGPGNEVAEAVDQMLPGGMEMLGGARGRSAKTGDDGAYELRGLQSGVRLQVRASAKGHAAGLSEPFELTAGADRSGVDLQLLAAGRIRVTMAQAAPFASARARLVDAAGQIDDRVTPVVQLLRNGAGTLDGLRPGRWRVEILMPGGEPGEPRFVDVVAGETAAAAF
jgi:hypothetical protein